jgi:hypothetical protein
MNSSQRRKRLRAYGRTLGLNRVPLALLETAMSSEDGMRQAEQIAAALGIEVDLNRLWREHLVSRWAERYGPCKLLPLYYLKYRRRAAEECPP